MGAQTGGGALTRAPARPWSPLCAAQCPLPPPPPSHTHTHMKHTRRTRAVPPLLAQAALLLSRVPLRYCQAVLLLGSATAGQRYCFRPSCCCCACAPPPAAASSSAVLTPWALYSSSRRSLARYTCGTARRYGGAEATPARGLLSPADKQGRGDGGPGRPAALLGSATATASAAAAVTAGPCCSRDAESLPYCL